MRCDVRAAIAQIVIRELSDYLNPSGRYEGEVNQDGNWHGKGVISWPDGRRYVGEWWNSDRTGHGTLTYPDGRVESGQWENDKFLG